MVDDDQAGSQEGGTLVTEKIERPSYDYEGRDKSHVLPGGFVPPKSDFEEGDTVQMRVPGSLNGSPVLTWKPFTIRGEPKYDQENRTWTYRLNKNGAKYEGDKYFPKKDLAWP